MIKRYASAAATKAKPETAKTTLTNEPVRVTKLNSGVTVASLENHSPVTRIAAVLSVGSRDEAQNEQGASHALRVVSSLVIND